ncbi:MAG TPA: enoyl-CoA hydratase/isomerase family protein [Solimonas sp.]
MPTVPAPALVFDADALAVVAQDPAGGLAFSPLSDTPFLLVDAGSALAAREQAVIAAWLRALPAPSIAIGGHGGSALARACDTQVDSLDAAQALLDGIRRAPRAATVLVQLLRATETMPVADALVAESFAYATLQAGAEYLAWLAVNRAPAPAVATDDGPAVRIARNGEDTLRLTLNRASNRNAMSVEMRDALCEALQLVLADASVACVRLDANGKCFSTGGDLTEFGSAPDSATAHIVRSLALPGRLLHRVRERVTVQVHGACIGSGIEFPAFAGRIEARANAWFQLPELKYGLIPGAGGCVSVARRIGRQRTAWMVLSGARIDAHTARDWGLVDAVVDAPLERA